MYRFLLSRRWLGLAAFVVFWVVLCVFLSRWQWHRYEDKRAMNAQISTNLDADPVPLDTVLGADTTQVSSLEWTLVQATGHYDSKHEITIKYQSRDTGSGSGIDVVTPLVLDDGTAILVDRGWFDTGRTTNKPSDIPPAPTGEVTVTGWLRPNARADDNALTIHDGQVRALSSEFVATSVHYDLRDGYINLQSQKPAPSDTLVPEPVPARGNGPHLFYSIQWIFFAALGPVGYVWFARNEARDNQAKLIKSK